jgi:hypothetical protein
MAGGEFAARRSHRLIQLKDWPIQRLIAGLMPVESAATSGQVGVGGFFFALGFTGFGCATGSGPRSIDDSRPAVKV